MIRPQPDRSSGAAARSVGADMMSPGLRTKLALRMKRRKTVSVPPAMGARMVAAEALHASGGVHQFLFAGKERMAVGADFQADLALVGGTGGKYVAARAVHANFMVCGMDSCLHGLLNLSLQKLYFSGFGRIWLGLPPSLDSWEPQNDSRACCGCSVPAYGQVFSESLGK